MLNYLCRKETSYSRTLRGTELIDDLLLKGSTSARFLQNAPPLAMEGLSA